jgi:hypothetical protein
MWSSGEATSTSEKGCLRVAGRANRIVRKAAVAEIAPRYREWVDIFEKARGSQWTLVVRSQ